MEMMSGIGGFAPQVQPRMTQPQMTPPATMAPAGAAASANAMAPAAQAVGMDGMAQPAAGAENTTAADRLAEEKAFAKVMNDRFNQECQTCKNRTYQDGSNDAGVSFKTPQHVDPSVSAAVVSGHEQEHVVRNKAAAEAEGGEVISSRVVLHGDICPECGRHYIAGGTTYTTTRHGGGGGQQNAQNQPNNGGLNIRA
ncbi:hypothetical protein LJC64_00065 [Ruminococcaceae bacterium OttesenSCG-928-A11]|nr:hypothetical protein [Ruminococcaceae bacterium OttesenSCG-928-A11]